MCLEGKPEVDDEGDARIFSGRYADGYLRRLASPLGYVIVVWRGRHVAEPTDLDEAEAVGYWLEVLRVAKAVDHRFSPAKLNLQILGNAVPHLHTHVIPRYVTDPAPGRPPTFVERETKNLGDDEYRRHVAELRATLEDLE